MSSFLNRIIASRKKSPSKVQTSTMKNIFKRSLANFRQSRARIEDVAIELSTPRSATPTDTRQRSATPRSASQRTATPISATQRTATPIETRQISATPISATPTSSASRTATSSMRRPVPQADIDKLKTTLGESIDLQTLNSKRNNTRDEILKKSKQILLLEQKFRDAKKKVEKDEYATKIKNLKVSKLALEQKLAEIKIKLDSAIETMQKYSKKGGTRKRRKYAKKY
jgi:hypothetical protein